MFSDTHIDKFFQNFFINCGFGLSPKNTEVFDMNLQNAKQQFFAKGRKVIGIKEPDNPVPICFVVPIQGRVIKDTKTKMQSKEMLPSRAENGDP